MYQNCCRKCGSVALHTKNKGTNVELCCDNCGAWAKRLGKDELHAFEYAQEKREEVDESKIADAIKLLRDNGYFVTKFSVNGRRKPEGLRDGNFDIRY